CLCGPFWRHERWVTEASRVGLAVEPVRRRVSAEGAHCPPSNCVRRISVTVVGERCFGEADEQLMRQALCVVRATRLDTRTVAFSDTGTGIRFLTANPW